MRAEVSAFKKSGTITFNWTKSPNSEIRMVADKIKIEKIPTSSVEKTDVLIGFSVVELPKNSLQM